VLRFVTSNPGKATEAESHLGTTVEAVDYDYTEIQAPALAPIAERGAREAFDAVPGEDPVLVDDAGLFVDALDGFPGPYSSYVEERLGIERVFRLVADEADPSATFRTVLAYCDGETVRAFEGSVEGRIVAPRGAGGFGYDPIFERDGRTFAELTTAEKNRVSHRGRALDAFAEWWEERDSK
jgi:XTP/dITP diphosphohydrolase